MADTVKVTIAVKQCVGNVQVELTRAQVEAALKELNTPAEFKPGNIVFHKADTRERWLVISTGIENDVYYAHKGMVHVTNGSITNWYWAVDLVHCGHLREGYIR